MSVTADLVGVPAIDGQLAIPTAVLVPESLDAARDRLTRLDGLATASEWARAAIVATFVDESGSGQGGRTDLLLSSEKLTPNAFAALGIVGLKSDNTVRRYLRAWGDRPRPTPGQYVDLPDDEFKVPGEDRDPHVANNSGQNEWYTPPEYIEAARRVMGHIALDPATSITAQRTVRASVYFTAEHDGLAHDWFGPIWMNPPYSQPLIGQFIDKLTDTDAESICLVNNGTETVWGQKLLRASDAVCFPAGRIRFIDPDGNPGAPLQGQMITYRGPSPARFTDEFAAFGTVMGRG